MKSFTLEIVESGLPAGIVLAASLVYIYSVLKNQTDKLEMNTALVMVLLSASIVYTLFLFWEAKKFTSFSTGLFLYSMTMFAGILQTLLPLYRYSNSTTIFGLILIILAFTSSIAVGLRLTSTERKPAVNRFAVLVFVGLSLFFMFFPFHQYYAITAISLHAFAHVFAISIVSLVAIIVSHLVYKKIEVTSALNTHE